MITTLGGFITKVKAQHKAWGQPLNVWFRGEPDCLTRLTPKLYRPKPDGTYHNENKLLQMFRMKASSFTLGTIPPRGDTDEWLFLAQHVGLPTRLLDWTESAILALYFSLKCEKPAVWMIRPMSLNKYVLETLRSQKKVEEIDEFPLTWFCPPDGRINIGHENIRGAWEPAYNGLELPVAVHPTYIHPRMASQRSTFTVHGHMRDSLDNLVPSDILAKLIIKPSARKSILENLRVLGIQEATAYPDLDGLARELSLIY